MSLNKTVLAIHFGLGISVLLCVAVQAAPIDVDNLILNCRPVNSEPSPRSAYRVLERYQETEVTGKTPEAVVIDIFGVEPFAIAQQAIRTSYPQPDQAVVILTQKGLRDDSVRNIQYRIELRHRQNPNQEEVWKVTWVGARYQCQPNRGHQDWSGEYCL